MRGAPASESPRTIPLALELLQQIFRPAHEREPKKGGMRLIISDLARLYAARIITRRATVPTRRRCVFAEFDVIVGSTGGRIISENSVSL